MVAGDLTRTGWWDRLAGWLAVQLRLTEYNQPRSARGKTRASNCRFSDTQPEIDKRTRSTSDLDGDGIDDDSVGRTWNWELNVAVLGKRR